MSEDFGSLKVISFETYNEEWLDFVRECRSGRIQGDLDIVCGGIANNKMFRTLDLYFSGDIG